MRKYSSKSASPARVEYGIDLVEGFKSFPETEPLAAGFEALNDELDEAHETRRRLRKPMLKSRANLRIKSYQTDKVIRQCARAAEIADGGRKGPIFAETFPQGLSVVVAPAGRKQLQPTLDLIDRFTRSRKPGIEALRGEWVPRLQSVAEALGTSINRYDADVTAVVNAFKTEVVLRQEHELAIDKLMGEVRALFPGDRTTQNAIFPELTGRTAPGEGEAEPETPEEDSETGGDPTAAP
jgi:hypothetical protein